MLKRAILVAALVSGCGPQPWSPTTTQMMLSQFQAAGATEAQAGCMVTEMQKRMDETALNRAMLQAQGGRLDDATERARQEVQSACKR